MRTFPVTTAPHLLHGPRGVRFGPISFCPISFYSINFCPISFYSINFCPISFYPIRRLVADISGHDTVLSLGMGLGLGLGLGL